MVLVSLIQTEALSGGLVEQCLMADILPTDRGDLIAESVHRTVGLAQIVVPVNFLVEGGQLVEYAIGVSRVGVLEELHRARHARHARLDGRVLIGLADGQTQHRIRVYSGRFSTSIRPGMLLSREPRITQPSPSE